MAGEVKGEPVEAVWMRLGEIPGLIWPGTGAMPVGWLAVIGCGKRDEGVPPSAPGVPNPDGDPS